jgi:hypothetical protein
MKTKVVHLLERWHAKIRKLRQHFRGWAQNVWGQNKKKKGEIMKKLDALDKRAEHTFITT